MIIVLCLLVWVSGFGLWQFVKLSRENEQLRARVRQLEAQPDYLAKENDVD